MACDWNFYLWKVHQKTSNLSQLGQKAFVLSLIGIGFGQVYNFQFQKGVIFASLTPLSITLVMLGITEKGGTTVTTLGIMTIYH